MTTDTMDETIATPQVISTPEVKPKHAGGRKPKGYYERGIQDTLSGSASRAAVILDDHIAGKRGRRTLRPSLQRACEYVIDHAIGKARQKVEHSGGIMTYKQLADSARELEEKPRDVLAEVEEIANKRKGELVEDTSPPSVDSPILP